MTRVLVTGATGQDAFYLMPKLAAKGYEVFGMVRNRDPEHFEYLKGIPFLHLVQADLLDYGSLVEVAVAISPDIVINLAGVTSPAVCWGTPELAFQTNGIGAVRLLDIIGNTETKFIQAGSIAEFGPYGASKLFAEKMMDDYREQGYQATTIRFGGHHSPRRSTQFFSRRVTKAVARIMQGHQERLELGPLTRIQDWGAAPDFMEAVVGILDDPPGTYTVSTSDPHSLEEFVKKAFEAVDLDWEEYVTPNAVAFQPVDVPMLTTWPYSTMVSEHFVPTYTFDSLIEWMVRADLEALR